MNTQLQLRLSKLLIYTVVLLLSLSLCVQAEDESELVSPLEETKSTLTIIDEGPYVYPEKPAPRKIGKTPAKTKGKKSNKSSKSKKGKTTSSKKGSKSSKSKSGKVRKSPYSSKKKKRR